MKQINLKAFLERETLSKRKVERKTITAEKREKSAHTAK
jgi:hypothetical protein